jgi:dipeptidyl aminopeptidase/acylaminoacyl peptidase
MIGDERLHHVHIVARRATEAEWSPDGSRIAYVGDSKPRFSPNVGSGLFVVGADGRGRRRVTRGEDWSPAWSPDGTTLAFARSIGGADTGIYVKRLGGGAPRRVFTAGEVGGNDEPGEVVSLSWSPTSNRRLAFRLTSFSPPHFYDIDDDEILIIELRDSRPAKIVSRISPAGTTVTWSPDGRFLLHGSYDDPSFWGDVPWVEPELTSNSFRITRPNGHAVAPLTLPQRASSPSWQPLCTRSGSGRADRIRGGSGDDQLCGLAGNDTITGGPGSDRLYGEEGNDTIQSRDGAFDVVGCGAGKDKVIADRQDLVGIDCEQVRRP